MKRNLPRETSLVYRVFTFGAGVLVAALGFAVITGWHLHIPRLIQISPSLTPMQYNTAMGFVLTGVALLLVETRMRWLAVVCGAVVAAGGALTLAQCLFGRNFGIDELLMRHYITTGTASPRRMATNSAFLFLLTGSALVMLGSRRMGRARSAVVELSGALVCASGVIASMGYLGGVEAAYGWGGMTRMAVHAAIGFILVGSSIFAAGHQMAKAETERWEWWLPISLGVGVAVASLLMWHALQVAEFKSIQHVVTTQAETFVSDIEEQLERRVSSLERAANRWGVQGGTPYAEWAADSYLLLQHQPGYEALEWVDSSYRVQWVVPQEGNEHVQGLNLSEDPHRRAAMDNARQSGKPSFTPVIPLLEGGDGVVIAVPVMPEGRFEGFLVGVLHIGGFLSSVLGREPQDYSIEVFEENRAIFQQKVETAKLGEKVIGNGVVRASGRNWVVRTQPTVQILAHYRTRVPVTVGIFGMLTAILLAGAVYQSQLARKRAKRIRLINAQLRSDIVARKHAEDALRSSNERFELVVQGTDDGIWDWNLLTDEIYFSARWKTMLGYAPHEITANYSEWESRLHPEDRALALKTIKDYIEGRSSTYELEHRLRHKDGTYRWILTRGAALRGSTGMPYRMVGSHVDLTDRKRAEQAVVEREREVRALLTAIPDMVFRYRADGTFLDFHAHESSRLYSPRNSIKGGTIRDLLPAETAETLIQASRTAFETKKLQSVEYTLPMPDGPRYYEARLSPVSADEIVAVIRDNTERKRSELAQRASEQRYLRLFRSSRDGIVHTAMDGSIMDANPAFVEMLGYTLEELKHLTYQQITPVKWHDWETSLVREQVMTCGFSDIYEKEYIRKDGMLFPVSVQAWLVRDEAGHPIEMWASVRDITKRKQTEKLVLEISGHEQQRIGQDLHDGLCQHLTGTAMACDALRRKLEQNQRTEAVDAGYIAALLKQAISEAREVARGLMPVDVAANGLVVALERLAASASRDHGVPCHFSCPREVNICDPFTANHLYRITQEAVSNAVRHGKPQNVWIGLTAVNSRVTLSVENDGARAEISTTRGDGLGLRIMDYRARMIGGALDVHCPDEGGVIVTCTIENTGNGQTGKTR